MVRSLMPFLLIPCLLLCLCLKITKSGSTPHNAHCAAMYWFHVGSTTCMDAVAAQSQLMEGRIITDHYGPSRTGQFVSRYSLTRLMRCAPVQAFGPLNPPSLVGIDWLPGNLCR